MTRAILDSDEALVDALRRREPTSAEQLVARCGDLAYRVALSSERAKDLVRPEETAHENESLVAVVPPEWPTYVVAIVVFRIRG